MYKPTSEGRVRAGFEKNRARTRQILCISVALRSHETCPEEKPACGEITSCCVNWDLALREGSFFSFFFFFNSFLGGGVREKGGWLFLFHILADCRQRSCCDLATKDSVMIGYEYKSKIKKNKAGLQSCWGNVFSFIASGGWMKEAWYFSSLN